MDCLRGTLLTIETEMNNLDSQYESIENYYLEDLAENFPTFNQELRQRMNLRI